MGAPSWNDKEAERQERLRFMRARKTAATELGAKAKAKEKPNKTTSTVLDIIGGVAGAIPFVGSAISPALKTASNIASQVEDKDVASDTEQVVRAANTAGTAAMAGMAAGGSYDKYKADNPGITMEEGSMIVDPSEFSDEEEDYGGWGVRTDEELRKGWGMKVKPSMAKGLGPDGAMTLKEGKMNVKVRPEPNGRPRSITMPEGNMRVYVDGPRKTESLYNGPSKRVRKHKWSK